ncbi:MAG: hypothetical protein R3F55_25200 [Alphaproteobacteria bacterium]
MSGGWLQPAATKVAPRRAGAKGRGVYATAAIAAGEVILCDCTIELSEADVVAVTPTAIDNYYFAHPAGDRLGLVVLGLASLCNHADAPSALTLTERDPELGWLVTLVAARAIAAGEEITRRYACPVWFEPAREA